ncbi:MAG: flagellar basal body P-ring formation protein FlgA [Planctomycetes bacterium]|nr:flagellar basal body P-ring formation protein FlgA [Planctomycetota bacterium]
MIALLLASLLAGDVVLRSEAAILGPSVELAEIAELRGFDAETERRLSSLVLGATPAPGATRAFRRDELAALLKGAGFDARLTGAVACRAVPHVETVTSAAIEEAARRTLLSLFAGRDVEITLVRPAPELRVVAAETRRDVVADLARREPLPGAWSVPVDVLVDGSRASSTWLAFDVAVHEVQPVAARDLRRGELLQEGAWRLQRVRLEPGTGRTVALDQLAGAVAARDIPAGARIAQHDVRRDPLVRAGDMVELEVVRGPLRARTRAVARGQGAFGDRVEVQTGEGQRRLVGTVVERGLIRVELAAARKDAR